jgi:hypothetical protein
MTQWRWTGLRPRIAFIDARAYIPLIPTLVIQTRWLILAAVLSLFAFGVLERFRFTLEIFVRWVRRILGGSTLPPFPRHYIRRHNKSY